MATTTDIESPKDVLIKWLDAWKHKDYKKMMKYSQISWTKSLKAEGTDPSNLIEGWWKNIDLKNYQVLGKRNAKHKDGKGGYKVIDPEMKIIFDFVVQTTCIYKLKDGKHKAIETRLIRMIRENEDGHPDEINGRFWGVNPSSANRTAK